MSQYRPMRKRAKTRPTSIFWMGMAYCALIVYGTLFPLKEWASPATGWINPITTGWPQKASRADIFVNVLAYVPLGLFVTLWLRHWLGLIGAIVIASISGIALSFVLEVLQSALPSRVPSLMDWVTNSAGAVIGASLAIAFDPHYLAGRKLLDWRRAWFEEGTLANLALVVLMIWVLTQAAPFVPSLDWGNIKSGLKPLGNTLHNPATFKPVDALSFGLQVLALGLIILMIARRLMFWPFIAFSLLILIYKVPVVGRQLTLEALVGWAGASVSLLLLRNQIPFLKALLAFAALTTAHSLSQFKPGMDAATHPINWIPFQQQVGSLAGMGDILETIWPFLALGLLARRMTPWRWRALVMLGGGLAIALFTFALEWIQQSIPGRFADVTDVLLAITGWGLPWAFTATSSHSAISQPSTPRNVRWAVPALAITIVSLSFAGWMAGSNVKVDTDEHGRAMLPAPESLNEIILSGFHYDHPRLPHPTLQDIFQLQRENPGWIAQARNLARAGSGDIQAVITMAYIEPGSQDLDVLFRRLMNMKYSYRGHEQAKPIAQAYDWLYSQWNVEQRAALREKLAEGVEYLVNYIRKERLSPYNVYLYNSPFQALMAANLALYGDDPRGELNMRFTYDLWKHRVLPVWRQVMGKNGGWHEGGEYVGIGIGQAIYQVPAMWRAATGEDLFKTEPGIRGFLDFIVYRKQPDGLDFRWGDAGFFDRPVPDLTPLALEYRHAPAYNMRPPDKRPVPSSWPWGPLTDATLLNPHATHQLPLARHLDGLGMVIARSSWEPDATYITFKAGDNYWSHSHLDQGAFTIYKGASLAIDSGFYGPQYGSDHHMNYTYQSIAHNLVTVTDPDDMAPSSGKVVREIANDGGQRRIGSGWGLESAPIDLNDWLDQRDLYHTGAIKHYHEDRDNVIVVADVTAAYTNNESGPGEFSHRTRRVERMWRTLIYDRSNDVVIIRDRVTSTRPEFKKRWLLHTLTEPKLSGTLFHVAVPPSGTDRRQAGGQLFGHIMLPSGAEIHTIGGSGYEFFVDGKNYDENGTLDKYIQSKGPAAETGKWRLEISPSRADTDDEFLVVLIPRSTMPHNLPTVRKLSNAGEHGVEISGSGAIKRYWFITDRNGTRLETPGADLTLYDTDGADEKENSFWNKLKSWWRHHF